MKPHRYVCTYLRGHHDEHNGGLRTILYIQSPATRSRVAGADRTMPRAPRGDQRPPIRSFGISGKALLLRSFLGISASKTAHSFQWTSRLACFPLVSVPISQGYLSCSMLETLPPTSRYLGIRCVGQYSVEDRFLRGTSTLATKVSFHGWGIT